MGRWRTVGLREREIEGRLRIEKGLVERGGFSGEYEINRG